MSFGAIFFKLLNYQYNSFFFFFNSHYPKCLFCFAIIIIHSVSTDAKKLCFDLFLKVKNIYSVENVQTEI